LISDTPAALSGRYSEGEPVYCRTRCLTRQNTLRNLLVCDLMVLRQVKEISARAKMGGRWNEIREPEERLKRTASELDLDAGKLSRVCARLPKPGKAIVGLPQPRETRVFIGTNYDVNVGIIPLVKEGIKRKNVSSGSAYVPVTLLDVVVPRGSTHDLSLILLHTCAYAIVDVSHPGGQFVEIERARDYGVNVLLVRQAATPIDPNRPPHISEMISTIGYDVKYYFDPRELIGITKDYLP